jgi:Uma2 family endonuclease
MDGEHDVPQEASRKLTYEDLLLVPDDGLRHELIDGVHYVTASPVTRHQRILRRLAVAIENWLTAHPGGEMFFAPLDVVLTRFDVVVPDLIYISTERSDGLGARGMFAAPDLAVEILSPSTRKRDRLLKRRLYEREGITEYWLIDPTRGAIPLTRRGPAKSLSCPCLGARGPLVAIA